MYNGRNKPAFRRNLIIPIFKIKQCYTEDGDSMFCQNIAKFIPNYTASDPQKTVIFTHTTKRTPNLTFLAKFYSKKFMISSRDKHCFPTYHHNVYVILPSAFFHVSI
jgi:hypothetical protein